MEAKELIRKLENNEKWEMRELEELRELATEDTDESKIIVKIEGSDHRWQREITTILKIGDKYVAIDWMRALTESQENDFWDAPYFVKPKTYSKTIVVTDWIKEEDLENE